MEKIENTNSRFGRLLLFFKNNLKYIIIFISLLLLIFAGIEYYKYYKINKNKEISKNYFNAIDGIYSNEINSIEIFKQISKKDSGFSLMSSMKLIDIYLKNNSYDEAYEHYIATINTKEIDNLYREFIILHACYNLNDKIESKKILDLISLVEIDKSNFKSHFYEMKYINSMKNLNKGNLNELNDYIQNDTEIIKSVKERVNKLNEYIKYN